MSRGSIYTDLILTRYDESEYNVHFYFSVFPVVVTSQESAVRRWMSQFNVGFHPQRPEFVTTFSLLWPSNGLIDEYDQHPAIIQLCVGGKCLVFQIARADYTIPSAIREFFQNGRFLFYAWSDLYDHLMLELHFGVEVRNQGWVPQRQLPADTSRRLVIEETVLHQLGCTVRFSEAVYRSRWDAPVLSIDQVQYAALEVCLAYLVARTSRSSLFFL